MGSTGTSTNTGVPSTIPKKSQILEDASKLKGEALQDAITALEWDGDWYREDKRQQKQFVLEVIRYNFEDDPSENIDVSDAVDTNKKILSAVYGVPRYSEEFSKKFGIYDMDKLYKRARRKK